MADFMRMLAGFVDKDSEKDKPITSAVMGDKHSKSTQKFQSKFLPSKEALFNPAKGAKESAGRLRWLAKKLRTGFKE